MRDRFFAQLTKILGLNLDGTVPEFDRAAAEAAFRDITDEELVEIARQFREHLDQRIATQLCAVCARYCSPIEMADEPMALPGDHRTRSLVGSGVPLPETGAAAHQPPPEFQTTLSCGGRSYFLLQPACQRTTNGGFTVPCCRECLDHMLDNRLDRNCRQRCRLHHRDGATRLSSINVVALVAVAIATAPIVLLFTAVGLLFRFLVQ